MKLHDLEEQLPPGQARVLVAIAAWRGPGMPTYRGIAKALGLTSTNTIYHHIRALIAKGALAPFPHKLQGVLVPIAVPWVR